MHDSAPDEGRSTLSYLIGIAMIEAQQISVQAKRDAEELKTNPRHVTVSLRIALYAEASK